MCRAQPLQGPQPGQSCIAPTRRSKRFTHQAHLCQRLSLHLVHGSGPGKCQRQSCCHVAPATKTAQLSRHWPHNADITQDQSTSTPAAPSSSTSPTAPVTQPCSKDRFCVRRTLAPRQSCTCTGAVLSCRGHNCTTPSSSRPKCCAVRD